MLIGFALVYLVRIGYQYDVEYVVVYVGSIGPRPDLNHCIQWVSSSSSHVRPG